MKAFTLCLKIFTFLILTWIFHCFYNYDSSMSLINKDTMQIANRIKHERLLAEAGVLEKKQTNIKERKEYYPSDEKNNKDEKLVYFKRMFNMWCIAITLLMYELFCKKTNEMNNEYRYQMLNINRNNNSQPHELPIV
ncbi:fam-g protein [Plasmodium gallinaceum]|uniref:Fam-g protein n=1 Tax=Plasmodium gallinaceum TaxID=5849 RepID=A0A1J1GU95_PLAGA|nr:fam-g protein [Plasmodium gallinaceum]CRG96031.1 fam-g protein [Plasmodium gallinaceum]